MTLDSHLIVVGVDGSQEARSALGWAIREARSRGGSVRAVHACRWEYPELRTEGTAGRLIAQAETMLAGEIQAATAGESAGVPIALEAVEGSPADVLVEAAQKADLLVLGCHGRGRRLHQILGSVSEACVRTATCPVVFLPH